MKKFNIVYVIASLICAVGLSMMFKSNTDQGLGVITIGLIISCVNGFAEKRSKEKNEANSHQP